MPTPAAGDNRQSPWRTRRYRASGSRVAHERHCLGGSKLALGVCVGCAYYFDAALRVAGLDGAVAEHVFAKFAERLCLGALAVAALGLRLDAVIGGKFQKRRGSYAAERKDLASAVQLVAAEAHGKTHVL